MADALSAARLLAAPVFAVSLAQGGWGPVVLVAVAIASDVADGRVARRSASPTRHGGILDATADVVFVLCGTTAAARLELVPWALPLAIACAAGTYAAASIDLSRRGGTVRLAHNVVGHAAGVGNWAVTGLAAGAMAVSWDGWPMALRGTAWLVAALNAAAVVARARR